MPRLSSRSPRRPLSFFKAGKLWERYLQEQRGWPGARLSPAARAKLRSAINLALLRQDAEDQGRRLEAL